ncbi:S-layer homology domain-containing protein [bacterium]|nr:S-layer homology domain-containing protein [bacterium]
MKHILTRTITAFAISSLMFASVASAVVTDANNSTEDPYTDNSSVAVTLEGSLNNDGNVDLSWSKYQGEDLKWYKVVRSQDNPDAKYPMDGYIEVYGDPTQTTYTDKNVQNGVNYYRLCVITTANLRGCSNTVTINKAAVASEGFADVPEDHWAKPYIDDLTNKGIVQGRDGKYEPDSPILRAEAIKMVMYGVGLNGSSCNSNIFPDLNQEDWFCDVVTKAYNKGIVKGDNGYLYPARNITRAEAVTILLKAKGFETPVLTENPFDDVNIEDWYAGYIYKAFKLGYVVGVGNNLFEPNRSITRAEMAKIVSIAIE